MSRVKTRTQIHSLQAALVIFAGTVGTVYFPLAAALIPFAGSASWWVALLTFLLGSLWVLQATWLGKQAPVGNFGVAVESWLGPILGKVFLLWFAAYWLILSSGILAEVSFVSHIVALPATPIGVLEVASLLLVLYTDLHGFETCMRTIQALLILAIPLMISFLLTAMVAARWTSLLPLLDVELMDVAKALYYISPYPLPGVLVTLFLTTKVPDRKNISMQSVLAVWIAGLLLSLIVAVTIAVLGCCVTESYVYPTIPLAQSISIGDTLVGVEILVYPLWLISGYIKSALAFVIASATVRALIPGLKQPWRTLGLGLAVLIAVLLTPNMRSTVSLLHISDFYLGIPFYLAIPGMAIWVKMKKWGKQHAK